LENLISYSFFIFNSFFIYSGERTYGGQSIGTLISFGAPLGGAP